MTDFKPPSESEFAKDVAKDVTKSWLQIAEVRMVLYVIPVAIAVTIISLVLSKCTR